MRLHGKRAIITGAGSGIGRAGALLYAREGAAIVAVDIDVQALDSLKDAVLATGGRIDVLAADLSRAQEVRHAVHEGARLLGGLDVLWANAGINGPASVEDMDFADYERTIDLNLTAYVVCSGEAAPLMRGRGGSIVMTASTAGLVGSIQSPVYSATKFAVVGLTKSLALKFASDGIRVNAVCPGPVETPFLQASLMRQAIGDSGGGSTLESKMLAAVPMGRFGKVEEIAEAALWLASDASAFVTGVALPVDGGLTAK